VSIRDTAETFAYPGFWKLAARYWRVGSGEIYRSLSKKAFVQALRKLLPELQMSDVVPGGAGVRAQALEPSGKLVDDFHFVESHRAIHVLNAPSPAATASLAIGRNIAEKAKVRFAP
jgi:L-2-hydroxyglutarate oxidase